MTIRLKPSLKVATGKPYPLGICCYDHGVNFAVYSPDAIAIDLCLFNEQDQELWRYRLPARTHDIWHGFIEGMQPGQRYGYRVHGPFEPSKGLWFNPNKVLLDPYAQEISAPLEPNKHMFAYNIHAPEQLEMDERDNAKYIPKCLVPQQRYFEWTAAKPDIKWSETILYELHPKGFSILNEALPEGIRGTYLGIAHPESIHYLKRLNITSVEILPCFAFMPEHRISELGLTNFWGYNPALFFAPEPRYAKENAVFEFKTMVNALHAAGIEVILDVVYNHTAEGGRLGPMICQKGLNPHQFYRHVDHDPTQYIDHSGCGNSVKSDHPYTLKMILDSMRHWMTEFQVDGFRFDLAASLGRDPWDFSNQSAFFKAILQDPILSTGKMIAEPWDIGLNGYQLGQFPGDWYECNDQFRDIVRRFWRGDHGVLPDFATRIMGSSDIFQKSHLRCSNSVNYIAYHDGFTLHDLVTYNEKHNHANLEDNRDGHSHNLSYNHGIEGETDDIHINQLRAKQKRNFIATLMLSQGAIHFLGGDEIGRTQQGNNNAYCQDNAINYLNWAHQDVKLLAFTQQMIALRNSSSLFRDLVLHDEQGTKTLYSSDAVHWYRADGQIMALPDWNTPSNQAVGMLLSSEIQHPVTDLQHCEEYYLVLFNASDHALHFHLPGAAHLGWKLLCDTAKNNGILPEEPLIVREKYPLAPKSLVVLGHLPKQKRTPIKPSIK